MTAQNCEADPIFNRSDSTFVKTLDEALEAQRSQLHMHNCGCSAARIYRVEIDFTLNLENLALSLLNGKGFKRIEEVQSCSCENNGDLCSFCEIAA